MDLATLRARIKALENKNMPDSVSPMELADLYTALADLLEAVPDSTGDVARLRTSLDTTAASLTTLQRSFDSHKASAIVADSAGFLPLTQQRPALMDFYCKDDFNAHSHAPAAAAYAVRLDLRKPTEANFPEEVLYTPDNCIVYDVATTRFCHRKTWQYSANGMTHTVTEFRNRWVGCEAWGELGDDGVKPYDGRAYFCNH